MDLVISWQCLDDPDLDPFLEFPINSDDHLSRQPSRGQDNALVADVPFQAAEVKPMSRIAQMMTLIADAFTRRLLQLAERELGAPPCNYAWLVAGSQARGEMHPFSDQDNALVLAREVEVQEIGRAHV